MVLIFNANVQCNLRINPSTRYANEEPKNQAHTPGELREMVFFDSFLSIFVYFYLLFDDAWHVAAWLFPKML